MTVIFKLRQFRELRNLTQQELATKVNMSRQSINNLEVKGERGELGLIRVKNLDNICKTLGVSPGQLLEFIPDYKESD